MKTTVAEFCTTHHACADGRDWALALGVETMAELWELPMNPDWRIWIAARPKVLTPKQRVEWACRCVRRVWHLLKDARSRTAVETAERWAIGEASNEELATARAAASTAASTYSATSVYYAASAAYAASSAASIDSAYYAVRAADYDGACYSVEREWQAQELIILFGNPFKKGKKK